MRYLSLFSGIGGFELGIQKAYVEMSNRSSDGTSKKDSSQNDEEGSGLVSTAWKDSGAKEGLLGEHVEHEHHSREPHCVGYSEIDKYAIQIYKKNFPHHQNYGDITKIKARELPDFDWLVGGFPCQAFSIAGVRRGFDDTRGTLFFDIVRILYEKRPGYFLLENVKGLLSHDGGKTFKTIISTLTELGYNVEWQVLNSKNFGVPQNRERVYIIGNSRVRSRLEVFPFRENGEKHSDQTNEQGCASTLTGRNAGGQNRRGNYVVGTLRRYKGEEPFRKMKDNISPTLKARARQDGDMQPVINIDSKIRRLTPKECERLQGFPDNWTEGVSDTQRYKTIGNAVTVNVIAEIFKRINLKA